MMEMVDQLGDLVDRVINLYITSTSAVGQGGVRTRAGARVESALLDA
jgi:hypothetical protein